MNFLTTLSSGWRYDMAPPLSFGVRLKMSILQNAIDSIVLGLEDFESSDHKRIICLTESYYGFWDIAKNSI